ncbi:unnamed protein product [Eretmochelys imbricata]
MAKGAVAAFYTRSYGQRGWMDKSCMLLSAPHYVEVLEKPEEKGAFPTLQAEGEDIYLRLWMLTERTSLAWMPVCALPPHGDTAAKQFGTGTVGLLCLYSA